MRVDSLVLGEVTLLRSRRTPRTTAHSEGQIETYAQIVAPFGHIVAIDDR